MNSSPMPPVERTVGPAGTTARPGDAAVWWVLAHVALLPFPGLAEAVLSAGALFAVVRLLQLRARGGIAPLLTTEAWGLTCLLFLAYWLPQVLAAADALDPGKALGKAGTALRYLPFMWLVAIAVATARRRRRVFAGIGVLALVWAGDALLQAGLGHSPLLQVLDAASQGLGGGALCPAHEVQAAGRYNGIFSECNPKLGQVLAVLAPFVLLLAGRRHVVWAALAVLCLAAVLFSGARAAWLSYGLVLLASGMQRYGRRGVLVLALAGVLGLGLSALLVPAVGQRVQASAGLLSGQGELADAALAGRGRIWAGALCMVGEHPVNGVGVRGFRHAWEDCDPTPAQPAAWGEGPALHAHQLVLEILAETGVLGLLLWLAGVALAIRAWRYAPATARQRAWPAALAVGVALFPLNTHLAVYSTFWGGICLLLAALYVGALQARE